MSLLRCMATSEKTRHASYTEGLAHDIFIRIETHQRLQVQPPLNLPRRPHPLQHPLLPPRCWGTAPAGTSWVQTSRTLGNAGRSSRSPLTRLPPALPCAHSASVAAAPPAHSTTQAPHSGSATPRSGLSPHSSPHSAHSSVRLSHSRQVDAQAAV